MPETECISLWGDAVILADPIQDEADDHLSVQANSLRLSTVANVQSDCVLIQVSNSCPVPSRCFSMLAPWLRAALQSSSFFTLFATDPTIHASFTSPYGMFVFLTLSDGDICIHHLATRGAETNGNVAPAVIKVGALVSLHHDLFLPSWSLNRGMMKVHFISLR